MKQGRHVQTRQLMTLQQYIQKFGSKLDQHGLRRNRPTLVCPACAITLHTVGENNAGTTDAFFAHDRIENGKIEPFCPLKESGSKKYDGLTPTHPNVQSGILLRENFMNNWRKHWALIKNYVEYPDIYPFINAIKHLDNSRTWQHAGLREELVSYIILSLLEFAPPVGKVADARKVTYRFWFDGTVRTIEDLWIRTTGEFTLIRASYLPSAKLHGKLGAFIECHDVPLYLNFLSLPLPTMPHPAQVVAMSKAFGTQ
jgi:hypothetical protein